MSNETKQLIIMASFLCIMGVFSVWYTTTYPVDDPKAFGINWLFSRLILGLGVCSLFPTIYYIYKDYKIRG